VPKGLIHVTDLVEGALVDYGDSKLVPVLPAFLRVEVPMGTVVGSEVYVVVKGTVQAVLPG
jgi:hypothetical protein